MTKKITKNDKRFFLPYLLIIVVMSVFNFVNYRYMLTNAENQSVSSTLTDINSITLSLENHRNNISQLINEVDTDASLLSLARDPNITLLDVKYLIKRLGVSKNSLLLADNVILYFRKSNIAVDCSSAYFLNNSKDSIIYSQGMTFEDLKSTYFTSNYYNTFIKTEALTYTGNKYDSTYSIVSSLPSDHDNPLIQVIVILNKDKIRNIISPIHQIPGAGYDLLDDKNGFLFGALEHHPEIINNTEVYKSARIDGKKHILYNSPIENTPWRLTACIPYNEAVKTTTNQKLIVYISLFTSIIVCAWFGISIAKSRQKEFDSILEINYSQDKQLKQFTPHIKEEFLRKTLLGEINGYTSDYNKIAEYVPAASLYCVLRINIKTDTTSEINFAKEMNLKKFTIQNVIEEIFPNSLYINIGLDSICFILYTNDGKDVLNEALTDISNIIETVLKDTINYNLSYSFGTFVTSQNELSTSFFEAHNSIILKEMEEKQQYDESDVFFPVEFETALISAVKHGSIQTIHSFFDIIEKMSFRSSDAICDYLKICLIRAHSEITSKTPPELTSIEEYKAAFLALSSDSSHNSQSPLFANIVGFINNSYSDPQLSRKLISDKFDISEEYVSMLFKRNLDITFLNYVEKIRIDKACEFLLDGKIQNIEDIAAKCGYLSTVSFRRAFKKVTGVVPSQYKE